jgi:hypothetical protein
MRLQICLLLVILFRDIIGDVTSVCDYGSNENRLLNNLDKLMNSSQVMIMKGVKLKKKLDGALVENESIKISCNTFSKDLQMRASRFINNHVLEFDIASMLTEGNAFS